MTSEVAILNTHAVVLAADSAVTISEYNGYYANHKYLKGANKVFELVRHYPIGIMVYNSAEILHVPWEIVIKAFRESAIDLKFNAVSDCYDHFLEYLSKNYLLFPDDVKREYLNHLLLDISKKYIDGIKNTPDQNASQIEDDQIDVWIKDELLILQNMPIESTFSVNIIDSIKSSHGDFLRENLKKRYGGYNIDIENFIDCVIEALIKLYDQYMGYTGIVIAGYGENDYFPQMLQFQCFGFILNSLIIKSENPIKIDHRNRSHISAFAINDMVKTFNLGISPNLYDGIRKSIHQKINSLGKFLEDSKVISHSDANDIIKNFIDTIDSDIFSIIGKEHHNPLMKAIAFLPKDELASLAENLVMLESLNERVTRPSESVGGPVDVAVISRSEGFVWIKRKHYFPAELNVRFFNRNAMPRRMP